MTNIVVLMGGRSLEREVSLKSGKRVLDALNHKGYKATSLDVDENLVEKLLEIKPNLVYIALHGKYGEDGTVQSLLDVLEIPYTGPGFYANIVSFNKILAKEIFTRHQIPTPEYVALSSESFKEMGASRCLSKIWKRLGTPIIVKPARQGSALGIKLANSTEELPQALIGALSYDHKVLLEKFIKGREITVSILGNDPPQALPIVEIVTEKSFFDFEAMYTMGSTKYFVPARLDKKLTKKCQEIAIKTHEVLGGRDVSRVDMIISDSTPYVLELNTSPGMTETSLLPMAASEAGIEFEELVDQLIQMALKR